MDDSEYEDEYEDSVCGAPDEPIRRQRQMVGHLENIETSVTDQKDSLSTQVPEIVTAVKMLVVIGWIIAALVGLYVVRHW
jgi:hypothetical protein